MKPLLRGIGVSKTYGTGDSQVHATRGVDFAVAKGTFVAVMGPSGSGKSTLLNMIGGLETPDTGSLFLGDLDLAKCSDDQRSRLRQREIAFIFQAFHLLDSFTVLENVMITHFMGHQRPGPRRSKAELRQLALSLLARLGLSGCAHRYPTQLSGGQQQRVAIARALFAEPDIILADEPTGNLDRASGTEVLRILRDTVSSMGDTVLMVTHDAEAASVADTVIFMRDGLIVDTYTPIQEGAGRVLDIQDRLAAASL